MRNVKGKDKTKGKQFKRNDRQPKRRGKEIEVNVEDSRVNAADLDTGALEGSGRSKKNDVSWYAHNPQLLKDSASFPFAWPIGIDNWEQVTENNLPTVSSVPMAASVPGIMAIHYSPTIGKSTDITSAVNIAARQIYSFVRHANSGHSNYDAPDLMMYLLAMDSAYSIWSYLVRAYGVLNLYSNQNRYYPRALVTAMGIDFDNAIENMANFRYGINQIGYKLAAMCVPGDISFVTRHQWLNSGLYLDGQGVKAQTYMFVPMNYYQFVEQTDGPAFLEPVSIFLASDSDGMTVDTGILRKVSQLLSMAEQILEPILASEDMNIMSGDILKAFGQDNLFKVPQIDESYLVLPAFNPEVLAQIENLTLCGGGYAREFNGGTISTPGTNAITQQADVTKPNAGAILQNFRTQQKYWLHYNLNNPYTMASNVAAVYRKNRKINLHTPDATPEIVMVATRGTSIAGAFNSETQRFTWQTYGSEIFNYAKIYWYETGQLHSSGYFASVLPLKISETDDQSLQTQLNIATMISDFDWAPQIMLVQCDNANTLTQVIGDLCDTDNYTFMSAYDLQKMNETAMLSMFSCPQMAALSARPNNSR